MPSNARSMRAAYAQASEVSIAPADATDGRTDGLTEKQSPNAESSANAPRAGGPNEVNQAFTVATGYGFLTRCGCGWRTLHQTKIEGIASGQRHVRTHAKGGAE